MYLGQIAAEGAVSVAEAVKVFVAGAVKVFVAGAVKVFVVEAVEVLATEAVEVSVVEQIKRENGTIGNAVSVKRKISRLKMFAIVVKLQKTRLQ